MWEKDAASKKQTDLRRRAEKVLQEQAEEPGKLAAEDVQGLIHELRTHQIELEMQNEELRRAQIQLEESQNRYSDLYDFAPVGYFTFDKSGLIIEVNLTGASKLGVERQFLIKKPFSIYIAPDSRDMFHRHMREAFRSGSRQTCELKLVDKSGNQFCAQLESLAIRESEGKPGLCRTAISDIMERKRAQEAQRKAHDELEIRVEERTAELAHTNDELNSEIIERKRAEEEVHRNAMRTQVLAEVSQSLTEVGLDYKAVLDKVVRRVAELIGDSCTLRLLSDDGKRLNPAAYYHKSPEVYALYRDIVASTYYHMDEEPNTSTMRTGKPLFIPSLQQEQLRTSIKQVYREYLDRYGIHSLIVVPLRVQGRIIGTLIASRSTPGLPYTENDLVFLQNIADRAALAIENARLFEKAQQELTERKQIEEALRRSEEKYRSIIETANEGIWIVDTERRTTYVNNKMVEMLGYSAHEMIGKSGLDFLDEEGRTLSDLNAEKRQQGIAENYELKLIRKDKSPLWTIVNAVPLFDKDGKFTGSLSMLTDITERKRAEDAVKVSEEKYRTLIENIQDGVFIIQDARIKFANEAFARIAGYTVDEITEKNFQELVAPEDLEMVTGRYRQRQMGNEVPKEYEFCMLSKDGKKIIVNMNVGLINYRGRVASMGTVKDITERKWTEEALQKANDELELRVQERTVELEEANKKILERTSDLEETNIQLEAAVEEQKRAEKALRSSETRYRGLAESIGEVFYAMDKDLRYIYWNNASEKLTGILAKDAIGKSLFEIFPELKGSKAEKLYREVLKTQRPKRFVNKYQINGENLFFEINAYYSKFGISVIAKDITERKHAEDQIYEQATLLDKAQDAIALRDLDHRIIYWNKGAEHMYGWTPDEAIGKNADKLLYKEETPKLIEAKRSVFENGEWAGELYQLTKDGKDIIVASRWTLMRNHQGKPKSILIINTGITEKKKLEAQFLRAQRMESIGTLAGGIAHDLNNVLTPVMLSIQILNEKFTDEQSHKLLDMILKNTQRGADLIKQVLSFARGIEGERRSVQVERLISEIGKVAKETFPRSIEIKTDISKDLWNIIGDATQLHQVLMNLCVNARDAMPDGGTLTISTGNVLIDEIYARMHIDARVGSYIIISISDTGTGIPLEIMDRIFDPFFTTKEQGKGTGLGLSTVLTIVKSHGGFIDIQSEVGRGTSFKVYLPAIAAAQTREGNAPVPELQSGHGESILIVDDEASILDVTGATLEQNGYRVLKASDGVEAISLYAQYGEEIKAVLIDMMMPVMDGPACIHALHKINPKIKIIGVSGLTEKGKLERIANIRVQAFLTKPYTSEMLLKTIREVISTK